MIWAKWGNTPCWLLTTGLLMVGCAGTEEYRGLAQAGTGYAGAMEAVLVDYRRTYLDGRSEFLLAEEALTTPHETQGNRPGARLPSVGEQTGFDLDACSLRTADPARFSTLSVFAREQCLDAARVAVVARLIAHSRLLGNYFAELGVLAASDAPQAAEAATGSVIKALGEVGASLNAAVPGQLNALAPTARVVTAAIQRQALRAELDRNKETIHRELAIQDKALKFLEEQARAEQAMLFDRRFDRLIALPVRLGRAGEDGDRWVENRRALLLEADQGTRAAAARRALQTLAETYEELVRGGDARALIGQLLADTSMVLDVVEPLVGRT